METETLLRLRNLLRSEDGKFLLFYMLNTMSEYSSKLNYPSECIRGMGLLIEELKSIEDKYNKLTDKE